jgi:Ca2+-binding EF-hand superfamily protein
MILCAELRLAFSMFDKDGDGQISAQEVRETMESLGIHVEPSQVKMMVKKVDTNGR